MDKTKSIKTLGFMKISKELTSKTWLKYRTLDDLIQIRSFQLSLVFFNKKSLKFLRQISKQAQNCQKRNKRFSVAGLYFIALFLLKDLNTLRNLVYCSVCMFDIIILSVSNKLSVTKYNHLLCFYVAVS